MDLRQASYVVAVAEHGTFTAAAASIPVSQPALSQAIAALERELGTPLFHRLSREVRLTAAGEAFLGPARRMLRDAEVARTVVAEVAGLQTGRLDVVALPTLVAEPLVGLVGRFRQEHPGVLVRITEPEDSSAVIDLVRSGRSEVGLGDQPVVDPNLESHDLGRQAVLAVLPPGTELHDDHLGAKRLASFPLITTPRGTSSRRLLAAALRQADPEDEPRIGVVTEHREAIVPLVMAGAGAAILAEPLARAAATLGAVVAPLRPKLDRPVVLVHRSGGLSPAAEAFCALALADRS